MLDASWQRCQVLRLLVVSCVLRRLVDQTSNISASCFVITSVDREIFNLAFHRGSQRTTIVTLQASYPITLLFTITVWFGVYLLVWEDTMELAVTNLPLLLEVPQTVLVLRDLQRQGFFLILALEYWRAGQDWQVWGWLVPQGAQLGQVATSIVVARGWCWRASELSSFGCLQEFTAVAAAHSCQVFVDTDADGRLLIIWILMRQQA